MNKASRILYILGAVFGFITAAIFFIVAIVYFVYGVKPSAPTSLDGYEAYLKWCEQIYKFAGKEFGSVTLEEACAINRANGIKFIVLGILLIAGSVVALVAKNYPSRNLPIHIVATVLNFDSLAMIGGILGIVSAAMALGKGQPAEEKPAEEKPAEEKAE